MTDEELAQRLNKSHRELSRSFAASAEAFARAVRAMNQAAANMAEIEELNKHKRKGDGGNT